MNFTSPYLDQLGMSIVHKDFLASVFSSAPVGVCVTDLSEFCFKLSFFSPYFIWNSLVFRNTIKAVLANAPLFGPQCCSPSDTSQSAVSVQGFPGTSE